MSLAEESRRGREGARTGPPTDPGSLAWEEGSYAAATPASAKSS